MKIWFQNLRINCFLDVLLFRINCFFDVYFNVFLSKRIWARFFFFLLFNNKKINKHKHREINILSNYKI